MRRKAFLLALAPLLLGAFSTPAAFAADYPVRPVELLCPYTPGSSMDIMARLIADIAAKYTGQPMPVVNKPGAGGSLAAADVISSKPDGYRIVTLANMFWATTTKTQKVPFDPEDLVPLATFMEYRLGLVVREDSPWKTFNDLIDYGRKNPGQLRWAHSGRGISLHVIAVHLFKKTGLQTIEVPYKGTPEGLAALLGGHVDAVSASFGPVKDHLKAGKLRCLTFYSDHRYSDYPNVPTVVELGFPDAAKLATYVGLFVHKNTPEPIKKYLEDVCKKIYDDPRFKKLADIGGEDPRWGGPEFMKASIQQATDVAIPILKETGLYIAKP